MSTAFVHGILSTARTVFSHDHRHIRDHRTVLLGSLITRGDLVFDIGAKDKEDTRIFQRLGARVIVVEPQEVPEVSVETLRERYGTPAFVRIADGDETAVLRGMEGPVAALTFCCRCVSGVEEALGFLRELGRYEFSLEPAPAGFVWISEDALPEVVALRCADGVDSLAIFARNDVREPNP